MSRSRLRPLLTALAACTLTLTTAACESAPARLRNTELVDVLIIDRSTGQTLPVHWHDGQRWVAGTPGHRYSVFLHSRSDARVLGVVAVDGVNAVSGETAAWDQRGYVLGPNQAFDILGWRKSQQQVADFVFTALEDSYAAQTGRPHDVGVIGIAAFREMLPAAISLDVPEERVPQSRRDAGSATYSAKAVPSAPAPSAQDAGAPGSADGARARQESALAERRLGTGHGPAETSVVQMTEFTRAQATPDQVVTIRYDRRERLIAMGIVVDDSAPRAFPQSAEAGFVPDAPVRR